MNSLKFMKFHFRDVLKSLLIFYGIYILVIAFFSVLSLGVRGGHSSGTELASVIYLFVVGLCSFRSPFYLSQALGVSRRNFYRSTLCFGLLLSVPLTLVDLLLNSLQNLFMPSSTLHSMIFYGGEAALFSDFGLAARGLLWTFLFHVMIFLFGFFLTQVYYRSNALMKVLVSVGLFALLNIVGNLPWERQPLYSVAEQVIRFFSSDLRCALFFAVMGVLFALGAWLFTRRAVIKK